MTRDFGELAGRKTEGCGIPLHHGYTRPAMLRPISMALDRGLIMYGQGRPTAID
jgi:hypothetical protein